MFFDGSFFLRNSVDLYLKNIPAKKKKNAIQLAVWEEKIFKGFLLWLPWQPELFMEHNYLKEFERGPPKEHSCEIWLKSSQQFLRRSFLKKKFTDACTDERTDGRMTDTTP